MCMCIYCVVLFHRAINYIHCMNLQLHTVSGTCMCVVCLVIVYIYIPSVTLLFTKVHGFHGEIQHFPVFIVCCQV